MVIPEINPEHIAVIDAQRARLGTTRGFIAVKPNCSIQSYVPLLTPLRKFGIQEVVVTTYQAISGAGKTFKEWPEMIDNIIPFIGGEEEKSENEPLKIWGALKFRISQQSQKKIARNGLLSTFQIAKKCSGSGNLKMLLQDYLKKMMWLSFLT